MPLSSKESLDLERNSLIDYLKQHDIFDKVDLSRLFTTIDIYTEELKAQNEELVEKEHRLLATEQDFHLCLIMHLWLL